MKPNEPQVNDPRDEAPEWFNRPITHEDMLAEAAAREEEKDFPKNEVENGWLKDAAKKGKPPF
jgi:hypothetical protein